MGRHRASAVERRAKELPTGTQATLWQHEHQQHADAFRDELGAQFSGMEVARCFFQVAKKVRDKAPMLGSFYKPVIAGVRRVHHLPSTTMHQQKKRDMLREWSTMGVSKQFLRAFEKEYVGTSWCVATLPAGYPTTNNAQEGMNSGVKHVWTRHERRRLLPFLDKVRRMLRNWSHDRCEAVPCLYPNRFRHSQSTLCCVAPRVGVRDSQSTLCCVAP